MVIHQSWDTSGYTDKQNHIRELIISPALEVIENIYSDRAFVVELITDEFSSVCPKTGLPDFATVIIRYTPDKYLVEEKSLKLYLTSYRNLGIFQENAINKIMDDFVQKVSPRWIQVIGNWKSRGGIRVNVEVEWKSQEERSL